MTPEQLAQLDRDIRWARALVFQAKAMDQSWYRPERAAAELADALERLTRCEAIITQYTGTR